MIEVYFRDLISFFGCFQEFFKIFIIKSQDFSSLLGVSTIYHLDTPPLNNNYIKNMNRTIKFPFFMI